MKLPVRNVPPWATRNQGLGGLRCILALLWLIPASVQAQTASPVQLDVGMDVAGPGQHVFLPVTLSTPAGATLSRVVLEATFSPAKLHYEETLAGAAAAVGIDGLFCEVHPNPSAALSDGPNSLSFDDLDRMLDEVLAIDAAINSTMPQAEAKS